jgi:hypothetical protein
MRHPISLGRHCNVAFQLRMHGQENIPHFFDWLGTPISGLIEAIRSDFDIFRPEDLEYVTDTPQHHIRDGRTHIVLFHQFPHIDGHQTADFILHYKQFIKGFRFQARRFREYVSELPVTLVRHYITKDEAYELESVFFQRFQNADAQFLYLVHDTDEFTTKHGHARSIPATAQSLGDPDVWIRILASEGLLFKPYNYSTIEILGFSHEDHDLLPDDRFTEAQLLSAIEHNAENPHFPVELIRQYRKRSEFARAEHLAIETLSKHPTSQQAEIELLLARWKGNALSNETVENGFENLLAKYRIAELYSEAAAFYVQIGKLDKASEASRRALDLDPLDYFSYVNRAISLYHFGDVASAERAMAVCLRLQSKVAWFHHLHSKMLRDLGRLDEAIAAEQHALHCNPEELPSLCHLGELYQQRGELRKALETWKLAIPIAGQNTNLVQSWIASVSAMVEQPA